MLVEAADSLLTEEGFHAISARRVAERAGLKPQLVHYYFESMDDLIVAVFERAFERDYEQNHEALATDQPLKALWKLQSNRPDTKRVMEFIAIGSHREPLRTAITNAAIQSRDQQAERIAASLKSRGVDTGKFDPGAVALLMVAVSRTLVMEATLGVTAAHAELRTMIESFLEQIEPSAETATP
jgi:AcrR family transcriptional regulator